MHSQMLLLHWIIPVISSKMPSKTFRLQRKSLNGCYLTSRQIRSTTHAELQASGTEELDYGSGAMREPNS